jgi:arylsulfatase A-like enzyme
VRKHISDCLHDGTDGKSIISGQYKLLKEAKQNGQTRLYDLESDPYEQHDLSDAMPERFATLSHKLNQLEESCQLSRDGANYSY